MKTAVLAGATGLVGGFLLERLLSSPSYDKVVALGRRPLGITHSKLESAIVDFNSLPARSPELSPSTSIQGADFFCALGTTIKKAGSQEAFRAVDHDAVLAFARWGLEHGARRFFLVSAVGADAGSKVFYNRVKGETENALAALGFEELHVFRPSLLLGERKETRFGEKAAELLMAPLSFLFVGPLTKFRPIPAQTVAEAMVRVAMGASSSASRLSPQFQEEHVYVHDGRAMTGLTN